jgi:O-antigen/teichoic acid export membrane protein
LYALIASLILSCVLGVVRLKHDLSKKNIATNKHELKIFKNKDLLMFWASSEVLGIMWIVRDKFAIFSVSEYMSAADIAVLFIMIRLIMPISMIKSSFNNIISPVIANLSHRRSFDKLSNKYSQLTKLLFLFVFPVFAILSTFGPEIVFIVLGEKYKLDLLPTSLLTWSVAVSAMLGPSGVALQMCGRPNIESIFLAGSLLAIVPLSMYLVPSFGLVGAILSVYMLITFVDLLRYFYVKKALHINAHEEKFGYKVILIMTIALLIIASNFLSPLYSLVSLILIYSMLFNKEIFSVVKNQKIFKY